MNLKKYFIPFIWLTIFISLYLIKLESYLLFHLLIEFFSILIAFGIFVFGWSSKKYLNNSYLLFISIGYIFIGSFDLIHALSYKGMELLNEKGADSATQFWIIARYLEALSFLIAFHFIGKKFNPNLLFGIYFFLFIFLIYSVLGSNIFPTCYINGEGLSTFKITSEYIIISILIINYILLHKNKTLFDEKVKSLINIAFIFTILSELSFTLYSDVYGLFNMIGHYLKLISFFYIYKAIIYTGLTNPMALLIKEINQKNIILIQQSHFALIGKLMVNIAHQWRQPLFGISLLAQALQDEYEDEELSKESFMNKTEKIIKETEDLSMIIDKVSGFFEEEKQKVEFKVKELIKNSITILHLDKTKIDIHLKGNELTITNFKKCFNQVILSLIKNSKEAIEKRGIQGKIDIDIKREKNNLIISIIDNGGGIDKEIINRIFEPYFTTKFQAKEVGLGLYITKIMVETKMDGEIFVQNLKDGVKFKLEIPL